jgi:hypothetical protein
MLTPIGLSGLLTVEPYSRKEATTNQPTITDKQVMPTTIVTADRTCNRRCCHTDNLHFSKSFPIVSTAVKKFLRLFMLQSAVLYNRMGFAAGSCGPMPSDQRTQAQSQKLVYHCSPTATPSQSPLAVPTAPQMSLLTSAAAPACPNKSIPTTYVRSQ